MAQEQGVYHSSPSLLLEHLVLVFFGVFFSAAFFLYEGFEYVAPGVELSASLFFPAVAVLFVLCCVFVRHFGWARVVIARDTAIFRFPGKSPVSVHIAGHEFSARYAVHRLHTSWTVVAVNDTETLALDLPNFSAIVFNQVMAALHEQAEPARAPSGVTYELPRAAMIEEYRKYFRVRKLLGFVPFCILSALAAALFIWARPDATTLSMIIAAIVLFGIWSAYSTILYVNNEFENNMKAIPETMAIKTDAVFIDNLKIPASLIQCIAITASRRSAIARTHEQWLIIEIRGETGLIQDEWVFLGVSNPHGCLKTVFPQYEDLVRDIERVTLVNNIPVKYLE